MPFNDSGRRRRHAAFASVFAVFVLALSPIGSYAQSSSSAPRSQAGSGEATPWPIQLATAGKTITVYTPQIDSWDGFHLTGRVAVQVASGDKPPRATYGILTLRADTLTDKASRTVTVRHATVTKYEFPSASAGDARNWADAVAQDFVGKSRVVPLDVLEAQLAASGAAASGEAKAPLKNDPPQVIFSPTPAILIYVDGQPKLQAVSGTPYQRVINTRPLLLADAHGRYFLKIFDGWMSSGSLNGSWTVAPSSADLESAFKKISSTVTVDALTGDSGVSQQDAKGQGKKEAPPSLKNVVPAIFIATTPTELIVTDGPPKYVPITGTQLLYAENTSGSLFKDISDNRTYVLISGRWFRALQENGPWEYVAANSLPADFSKIPDDSPKENVKASIAGTSQAREAAISAGIPQTAAVKVAETKLTPAPHFDGDPVLLPISGTELQYVANTSTAILRVDASNFYALQNGVWFHATSVSGPWAVALTVPAAIYTIPPSSPMYYTTFVRIYGYGDGVVYVGYTSGYMGTMVDPATGVVVYGTGYVYDPWTGTYWYGAPVTYGYGAAVAYTPWTGWAVAFCFGWAWGAAMWGMGWGWGPYPYWGPWAYPAWGAAWGPRGGAVAWGPGGWAGYTGNIYSQWGNRATVSRFSGGYNAWTGTGWASQVGRSYNSRTGIASAGQRGAIGNVYTGNFAAGSRGVAVGPQGNVVVGGRGIAGNANTGNAVAGGGGAFYNKDTGQWTTFGHHTTTNGGTVGHIGDNVYAGKDGNVYRHTDSGWEQRGSNGWSPVAGSGEGEATRNASGGLGASHEGGGEAPGANREGLERDRSSRELGTQRAQNLHDNDRGFGHAFGGGRMGGFRGGFHGGFRR